MEAITAYARFGQAPGQCKCLRQRRLRKGNVLVSIHGAGGMRISPAHELLAKTYRVVVFEVPGFGTSPANERSAAVAR